MVSHTTTGEWQSFELRMRRRRAERLLLRAEAAIDAGCFEDAQQCLTEARSLVPALPGLDDVERKLSAPVPEVQRYSTPRRVAAAAAILAMLGTAVVGGWMITRSGAPHEEADATTPSVSTPSAATATPAPLPSPADVFAAEIAKPTSGTTPANPLTAEPPRQEVPTGAADTPLTHLPLAQIEPPAFRPPAPEPPPAPAIPTTPEPAPVASLNLPVGTSVGAPPSPVEPAPAPEPSQEPAVRSVLDRYASAYSALDVDAAQRVWPAVNRGALARAFDSLAAQQVSLGDCRIDVIGASATARCTGTTSWSPKVGDGGQRTEARSWTFELARGAAGWEIVSARVQNR